MSSAYLDHAATAPVWPEVRAAMAPFIDAEFANPSSLYAAARTGRKAIEEAREEVAAALGARPEEVVFTGGGTEADNLAVLGVARARRGSGRDRVVVSAIEHHAVLDSALALRDEGFDVQLAPVTSDGVVDLDALAALVDERTALVSVMAANNETGVLQPIAEVAQIARAVGATTHTDAVQAFPWRDLSGSDADLIAVSAHKLGGPKGTGALVVRRGTPLRPLVYGGGQERGRRPGTLNTAGIAGFAAAVRATIAAREATAPRVRALRDALEETLSARISDVSVSGSGADRLPGHLHLVIERIESEPLLLLLDADLIAASSGSACQSGAAEPSHVLLAMGIGGRRASGALRLSLGRTTTEDDLAFAVGKIVAGVERLRR